MKRQQPDCDIPFIYGRTLFVLKDIRLLLAGLSFHRFVHLLAEQEQGALTSWRHYLTEKPPELQSSEFNDALQKYAEHESSELETVLH